MRETHSEENPPRIGRLLMSISRMIATRTDRSMDHIGLYRTQAFLLMKLAEHEGLTHSELANVLEISPAAATKVIKRMEALHYLRRSPDAADERVSRVFLEEEGRAVIQQIKHIFEENNQLLLQGLSPEEQAALRALLQKVHASLQKSSLDLN